MTPVGFELSRRRVAENPIGRADQVIGNSVGRHIRRLLPFCGRTETRPDQHSPRADGPRQLDVQPPVADHERS